MLYRKCDRCGTIEKEDDCKINTYEIDDATRQENMYRLDLCEECIKDIVNCIEKRCLKEKGHEVKEDRSALEIAESFIPILYAKDEIILSDDVPDEYAARGDVSRIIELYQDAIKELENKMKNCKNCKYNDDCDFSSDDFIDNCVDQGYVNWELEDDN